MARLRFRGAQASDGALTPLNLRGPIDAIKPWQINAQHVAVQKKQGTQGPMMCGGGNPPLSGQHGQESLKLCGPHIARMPHWPAATVPTNEQTHPIQIDFFRAEAIVQIPNAFSHLIQQAY
jgi:hypothetical protein